MMAIHRRVFCTSAAMVLGVGLAGLHPLARAQVSSLGDAINKAGRLRMLSQRMAKAWLGLGQGIQADAARRVLEQSMALFDRQLSELKAFAPAGDTKATYTQLEAAWSDFKGLLVGTAPTRDKASAVLAQAGTVLALANKGTGQLELQAAKPAAKLINVAGRQRMLSQRMAQFYLANMWNVDGATSLAELAKARTEFVAALEVLRNAPEANTDIKQELAIADSQWLFFDNALKSRDVTPKSASDVFVTSENLLQVMDRVTGMYARILS